MNNNYLPENITSNGLRAGENRRQQTFFSLFLSPVKRQRRAIRRDGDRNNTYVDIHEKSLFAVVTLTIIFCIADAFFTLIIIENGGEELNPFMEVLMNSDVMIFFWVKFFITAFGMIFLVAHKYFTVFRVITGYHFIYSIFSLYLVLIIYELYLLALVFKIV